MEVRKCHGCGAAPVLKVMLKSEGYDADLFQFEHDGIAREILADCEFNGDAKRGPEEMPFLGRRKGNENDE